MIFWSCFRLLQNRIKFKNFANFQTASGESQPQNTQIHFYIQNYIWVKYKIKNGIQFPAGIFYKPVWIEKAWLYIQVKICCNVLISWHRKRNASICKNVWDISFITFEILEVVSLAFAVGKILNLQNTFLSTRWRKTTARVSYQFPIRHFLLRVLRSRSTRPSWLFGINQKNTWLKWAKRPNSDCSSCSSAASLWSGGVLSQPCCTSVSIRIETRVCGRWRRHALLTLAC